MGSYSSAKGINTSPAEKPLGTGSLKKKTDFFQLRCENNIQLETKNLMLPFHSQQHKTQFLTSIMAGNFLIPPILEEIFALLKN